MNVAYQLHVEFDQIRLEIGQQIQPGVARTGVVDSQGDAVGTIAVQKLDEAFG